MWNTRAIAHTAVALSIAISGNHFVNGAGQTVRLLGVDHQGTEYACEQGWGYSNGVDTPAEAATDAANIAAWHADAVRIPLNEDCWLGIDNAGFYGTAAGYQQAVEAYVNALNANGIYAILDLHWSAPGTVVADGQRPMADAHSVDFWTSVATAFRSNHAVVFDAFNEPYSPAADGYSADQLTWSCWEGGGCTLPSASDADTSEPGSYMATGMQQLVTAIRNTGATQPILLGGLYYSNDLTGWLSHEPTDPDHQLAASMHAYEGNACSSVTCFNSEVAPVAAQVPVVISEFDENACAGSSDSYDDELMNWADQNGVSYLAWGWAVGATLDCNGYWLVDENGNAVAPNGTLLKAHLAALTATPPSTTTTTTTPTTTATTSTTTLTTPTTTTTTTTVNPMPAGCVVPKLMGVRLARARLLLRGTHCAVGRITFRQLHGRAAIRARHEPFEVIAQSPARGRHLRAGAKIDLVLQRR